MRWFWLAGLIGCAEGGNGKQGNDGADTEECDCARGAGGGGGTSDTAAGAAPVVDRYEIDCSDLYDETMLVGPPGLLDPEETPPQVTVVYTFGAAYIEYLPEHPKYYVTNHVDYTAEGQARVECLWGGNGPTYDRITVLVTR